MKRHAGNRMLKLYEGLVLDRPVRVLAMMLVLLSGFAAFIPEVRLDVSADSLTLEHDRDLQYYRDIRARYGSDDFLIVTWTPQGDMFSATNLKRLGGLRDRLRRLDGIGRVTSILDVPLLESPPLKLEQFAKGPPTLKDDDTDPVSAKDELTHSPLYRNRLISPDGDTSAIQLDLKRDDSYQKLLQQRDALREKRLTGSLTAVEQQRLRKVSRAFKRYSREKMDRQSALIGKVRGIMDDYRSSAELHLGGVPMVVADMMRFIRHDLAVFGGAVLAILAMLLAIIFRKLRWVLLPLATAAATGVMTAGFLGMIAWPVTVVASNFLPLLLIFSMSLTIHLIVRYRELQVEQPGSSQRDLVRVMLRSKAIPCLFTVITTMVAFASLVVSDIRPVITFGWIMVFAMAASMLLAFTLFPAALVLMKPAETRPRRDIMGWITGHLASLVCGHGGKLLLATAILTTAGVAGITHLTVENRFIDYFHSSTEIYQGMTLIDRKLGGTTPLDVIIDAPKQQQKQPAFDDPFASGKQSNSLINSYWFNVPKLEQVADIHAYLDSLAGTGKVLSLHTTIAMLKTLLAEGDTLDSFFLSILYRKMPQNIRDRLVAPYISDDGRQIRFAIRVHESDIGLNREKLLHTIREHLDKTRGQFGEQVHLTGLVVLYNNLLQSLFRSQIQTIGVIFLVILITFALLFRSLKVAFIAIVPNIIPVVLVLGLMGGLGIPLDIMTITIAAIAMGIAVDDTIHYVHRYREEWQKDGDDDAAVSRAHGSIGRAIFYTTITISIGFLVMVLSNFMPTIYFGLFTAFAMAMALLVDLTLLPILFRLVKPYKRQA